MNFKPNDYVITNQGKLGKIILPGHIDHEARSFAPASVQLNTKVYQIWQNNLFPVDLVALNVMNDDSTVILKAETAFNLVKVLLRNRIKVRIDVEETKALNVVYTPEIPDFEQLKY